MKIGIVAATLVGLAFIAGGCVPDSAKSPPTAHSAAAPSEFTTLPSGARHHGPTDTVFPPTYDTLQLLRALNRGQDAHVGYGRPDSAVALTFFLYRPGSSPDLRIERGIRTDTVEAEYRHATQGFAELAGGGMFTDLSYVLSNAQIDLPTKSGPLPARWTIVRYRLAGRPGGPLIGHLIVTGYQDRFLKIRLSYPDPTPEDLPSDEAERKAKLQGIAGGNMAVALTVLGKTDVFLR